MEIKILVDVLGREERQGELASIGKWR